MGKKLDNYTDFYIRQSFQQEQFYFKMFKRILLTMFKWNGLEEIGISSRFVERTLFEHGQIIIYKSEKLGCPIATQCAEQGLNLYGEPIAFKSVSVGQGGPTGEIVKREDCAWILNDNLKEGNMANALFFAKKLLDIEKTIDINLIQLRHPTVLGVPEGQKLTADQFIENLVAGVPFMKVVKDDFTQNIDMQAYDMKVSCHLKELMEVKHDVINDGLTFFGINNVNVLKRERLTSGETEQNDDWIGYNLKCMLDTREKGCKEIKEKLGFDVSVEVNKDALKELQSMFRNGGNGYEEGNL